MDVESVIKSLRSILVARETGMLMQDLVKEYNESEGTQIPYRKLGYNSLLELLRASDRFDVNQTEKNNYFVTAKPSANSKHVNDFVKKQNSKHKSQRITIPNDNNNNNQTGQAHASKAVYHNENKIDISDRLKHDDDGGKRYRQNIESYRREPGRSNGPHTPVGFLNRSLSETLNGPFDPQRWTMNRRIPLADRNFKTMNVVPPKVSVQIRLEIPKLIEMNELPEGAIEMADAVSQIDGWNFQIDHISSTPSVMQQTYNHRMTVMDGSVHNGSNLASILSDIKHTEASETIVNYRQSDVHVTKPIVSECEQLQENKAVTDIPSLDLPWYDNEWPITVTTVASTDDVWGYLCGHDYFPKLESTLKKHEKECLSGKKVPSIAKNIKPGGYYYIMIPECYRLRVLDNNENERKALCLLIDYAEDEWFAWDEMYEMDHNLLSIPSQAVRFSLMNLEEFASHKAFTNKAITCLIGKQLVARVKTSEIDFAMQKSVNRMDPKVKILVFNQITGQNLNEVILEKDDEPMNPMEQRIMVVQSVPKNQSGRVDVEVPIPMETEPIVKQMKIPIRHLPAIKQVTVIITSVSSPCDFHFRLFSDNGIMSSLIKSLSTASFDHRPDSDEIKPGNYYAAKFTDGRWYRLLVKDLIGNAVDVYRCDVGDTQRLLKAELCPLTTEFVQWPQLAIPAKIGGIIPVGENWTVEAIAYFRKLTLNVTMLVQFTETHASDRNGVTYPIEVILIENQIRCRIGDIMTEQRLAKKA